jgi:hypothetical protein
VEVDKEAVKKSHIYEILSAIKQGKKPPPWATEYEGKRGINLPKHTEPSKDAVKRRLMPENDGTSYSIPGDLKGVNYNLKRVLDDDQVSPWVEKRYQGTRNYPAKVYPLRKKG